MAITMAVKIEKKNINIKNAMPKIGLIFAIAINNFLIGSEVKYSNAGTSIVRAILRQKTDVDKYQLR